MQDEIIRMAREACAPNQTFNSDEEWVKHFAALVAANEKKFWMEQIEVECNEAVLAEREACAKVCDEFVEDMDFDCDMTLNQVGDLMAKYCAAAIRARSDHGG